MHLLTSPSLKTIIGWSPKCACTSLKHWWLQVHNIQYNVKQSYDIHSFFHHNHELTRLDFAIKDPQQLILVIRNPYERIVSSFLYSHITHHFKPLCEGSPLNSVTFRQFIHKLYNNPHYITEHHYHHYPQFKDYDILNYNISLHCDISETHSIQYNELSKLQGIVSKFNNTPLPSSDLKYNTESKIQNNIYESYPLMDIEIDSEKFKHIKGYSIAQFYDIELFNMVSDIYKIDVHYMNMLGYTFSYINMT